MAGKLYTVAILSVWAASMGWLLSERVLPAMMAGDAPRVGFLHQLEPVGWRLSIDGQPCGSAVLQALRDEADVTEVYSRVTLDRLAPPKSAPPWLAAIATSIESLGLDINTRSVFDPTGQLARFRMRVGVSELNDPVVVVGLIEDAMLRLRVRAGFIDRRIEHAWPANGLLASELMPEAKVLSAYVGRRWKKEIYSPLSPTKDRVEVLEAEVVEERKPTVNGKSVRARYIEFRAPVKAGVSDDDRLRGTMLVSESGRVLQHESYFLGSKITFDRLSDREALRLADERLEIADPSAPAPGRRWLTGAEPATRQPATTNEH